MKPPKERLLNWAQIVKRDVHALYLAAQDQRMPWYAKALAVLILGYALSPIDLIPDFVPVLGYLDDLILLPLGMVLVVRLIPAELMEECRARADQTARLPTNRTAVSVIVAVWLLALGLGGYWLITNMSLI